MKIGNLLDVGSADLPKNKGVQNNEAKNQPVSPVDQADKVHLSESKKLIQSDPVVDAEMRADKIEEVREAIKAGTFKVDVRKVADRMINEAASLLQNIAHPISEEAAKVAQPQNSHEKFGAGPANARGPGPDR